MDDNPCSFHSRVHHWMKLFFAYRHLVWPRQVIPSHGWCIPRWTGVPGRAAPPSKTTAAPGLSSGSVLPLGTYTAMSEAKIAEGMALLDTKTVSFTADGSSTPAQTPAVSEAPTQVATGAPTQAVSVAPTAPMIVVTTEESPVTPGAIATRSSLSAITIMLALTAVSGILVLRRRN